MAYEYLLLRAVGSRDVCTEGVLVVHSVVVLEPGPDGCAAAWLP